MEFDINYENSIANEGSHERLHRLFKRAIKGEKLVIGFIGGSITQGSLSTAPDRCYAYHVYNWFKEKFRNSSFEYVNAGIGATTSHFASARCENDLLRYSPDFVITEFSVNDKNDEHFMECYEGLIRRIYGDRSGGAVVIVNNVFYDSGKNAQSIHNKIGAHYNIPCISMQSSIYPEVANGNIPNRLITPDDLHPNDLGHKLVASVIIYYLEKVLEEVKLLSYDNSIDNEKSISKNQLPSPLTANTYEHAYIYDNRNCSPKALGFYADPAVQLAITDIFKNGWISEGLGSKIHFDVEGSGIAIQYRKSVKKPAEKILVVIDGDENNSFIVDANFDEDWGDKLELTTLLEHTDTSKHTVDITVTDSSKDYVPFYLNSIIVSR